jgi:hypothetical protein
MLRKWSTRIPEEIYHRLRRHAANRSLRLEEFAEIALETYMNDYEKENENKLNARATSTIRRPDRGSSSQKS